MSFPQSDRRPRILLVLIAISIAGWVVLGAVDRFTAKEMLRIHEEALLEQAKVLSSVWSHLPAFEKIAAETGTEQRQTLKPSAVRPSGDRSKAQLRAQGRL